MRITHFFTKATVAAAALAFATVAFAASGFVGKWKTEDTKGQAFTIWLSDDGVAKGDEGGKALAGSWKEEGNAAVITWDTGWVTTLTKEGDKYTKTATENGKPAGKPTSAEKVE
jgi:hypothetical protein